MLGPALMKLRSTVLLVCTQEQIFRQGEPMAHELDREVSATILEEAPAVNVTGLTATEPLPPRMNTDTTLSSIRADASLQGTSDAGETNEQCSRSRHAPPLDCAVPMHARPFNSFPPASLHYAH